MWFAVKQRFLQSKLGFTLVELSIVLVIIGLIAGGILAGKSLIYASEIRSVISQEKKYEIAFKVFKNKYNCLPGDCSEASAFFKNAINGDGNGIIITHWIRGKVESLQIWNQLSSAQLINGTYQSPDNNIIITLGVTNPSTTINSAIGFALTEGIHIGGSTTNYDYNFQIGSLNGIANDFLTGSGFNATDAYYIDSKIDDGLPSKGKINGINSNYPSTNNSNTTCLSGTNYKLNTLNTGCIIYYGADFN